MNDCPSGVFMTALKETEACRISPAGGCRHAHSGGRDGGAGSSGGGLGREGRRPVPRQQLGEARTWPALGHLVDDAGKIGMRIEAVQFGGFNNRVNMRRAPATFVTAQEEVILSGNCNSPQPRSAGLLSMARRPSLV